MKQNHFSFALSAILFIIMGTVFSSFQQAQLHTKTPYQKNDNAISTQLKKFEGTYVSTGSRILYQGKASNGVIQQNINLETVNGAGANFEYMFAINDTTLQIQFADDDLREWQYLITQNQDGSLTVKPSVVMASQIIDGNLKVKKATYNSATKTFHFITSYTRPLNDERATDQTFVKQ